MQSGVIQGPVSNRKIIEYSPVEKIAKMLDFYFPYLVKNLYDVIMHETTDGLNEKYHLDIKGNWKQEDLIEYFWAIAKQENVDDLIFFFDYRLYVNFFLQYPILTGKKLNENLNFSRILEEYREMDLLGSVAFITEEDEVYFVYREDIPEEIANIDETIAQYQAESKIYQADKISKEKGMVCLELIDGTVKEGISWGISGVYTGNGYEIKQVLTLANSNETDYIHLEEDEIKCIL